jgi:hypothetical protein
MALKKPAPKTKTAAKPVAAERSAPASRLKMGRDDCCRFWSIGLRLWWSFTWRNVLWFTLPVMVFQFILATLRNPEVPHGLWGLFLMMTLGAPRMLATLVWTPEFWFFIAVTAYTWLGALFVYAYLAGKKRFLGLKVDITRE